MWRSIGRPGLVLISVLVFIWPGILPAARPLAPVRAGGQLIVAPSSGPPGAPITVSAGSGVIPGGGAQLLVFHDANGSTVTTLGQVRPAADGSFSSAVQVPQPASGGAASISVQGFPASAVPFQVLPVLVVTPTTVLPGASVTVSGNGYKALAAVTFLLDGTVLAASVTQTNLFGGFSVTLPLPSTLNGGTHSLVAFDGTSTTSPATAFLTILAPTATPTATLVPSPTPSATVTPIAPTRVPTLGFGTSTPTGPFAAPTTAYLAEGYTGTAAVNGKASFTEFLHVVNPAPVAVTVTFTYYGVGAVPVVVTRVVPGQAALQENVNADVGSEKLVSAVVSAPSTIYVSRALARVSAAGRVLDGSSTAATTALSSSWDFAEGYTGVSFQEYLTLFNPSSEQATVRVTLAPQAASAAQAVTFSVVVPAYGRVTSNIRALNKGGASSIGMQVRSSVPIAAERVLYFGAGSGSGKFGSTVSSGLSAPATTLLIPYGLSGGVTVNGANRLAVGNQEFVTILNPGAVPASVSLHAVDASGHAFGAPPAPVGVAPGTRRTIALNTALSAGAGGPFSLRLQATAPVEAEAAQYYGGSPNLGTHPGVALPATAAPLTAAYLTDLGDRSGQHQIILYNPGVATMQVVVRYFTQTGATTQRQYSVVPGGITVVSVHQDLPAAVTAGAVGATLQLAGGSGGFLAVAIGRSTDGLSATAEMAIPAR